MNKKYTLPLILILTAFLGCKTTATHTDENRSPSAISQSAAPQVYRQKGILRSDQSSFDIEVRGGDDVSFTPSMPKDKNTPVIPENEKYDAVVVGGGLAGLTAAFFLTENGKRVLLLEKEQHFGGLAAGFQSADGIMYDRGAAYFTNAYQSEFRILQKIGLNAYKHKYEIHEPIDTYLLKGVMYGKRPFDGMWDDRALGIQFNSKGEPVKNDAPKEPILPASFAIFKLALEKANLQGLIPNQPFEEAANLTLDKLTASDWIRQMPAQVKSAAINSGSATKRYQNTLERFQTELAHGKLNQKDPMIDVLQLMELYCRSALGTPPDKLSAVAFANFYISELVTRYTSEEGTGVAARKLYEKLQSRKNLATLVKGASVLQVQNLEDAKSKEKSVGVAFKVNVAGGKEEFYTVNAPYAVYASQLKFAPKIIKQMNNSQSKLVQEQVKLFSALDYSHYSVHAVQVEGHPYRLSYDTWVRPKNYNPSKFTDLIVGRWMNENITGYLAHPHEHGNHEERKYLDNKGSILSIYNPISREIMKSYNDVNAAKLAEQATNDMAEEFKPLLVEKLKIRNVVTHRWPYSVHVAVPSHFSKHAKIMRMPFGRIYFAHSNLGTPAFEEALFRGHCAAERILMESKSDFRKDSWSTCPSKESDDKTAKLFQN